MKIKVSLSFALLCGLTATVLNAGVKSTSSTLEAEFLPSGKSGVSVKRVFKGMRGKDPSVTVYSVKTNDMPADARAVTLHLDIATAKKGESGWWLCGRGAIGYFNRDEFAGGESFPWTQLPYIAMKTPRNTFIAVLDGARYDLSIRVRAEKGVYRSFPEYRLHPYAPEMREDITVTVYELPPTADYNEMAKVYRRHREAQNPDIVPLKKRMKSAPYLEKLVKSLYVRQWHAMKRGPGNDAKILDFTPETEFPVRCIQKFSASLDTLRKYKEAGIDDMYFCVSGWQTGGYDGRCPSSFPVCEEAGGEAELRKLIAGGQALGYLVDGHSNFTDCFTVSPLWDNGNVACKGPDGKPEKNGVWCGGQAYNLCLKSTWSNLISGDLDKIAELGFKGCHYVDVFTCCVPYRCLDPNHPASAAEQKKYQDLIIDKCRKLFGGFASECAMDHHMGRFDFLNYVSNWERGRERRIKAGEPTREDEFVPFFELAYHDVVLSTRDRLTQGFVDRIGMLKNIEFGSRPVLYKLHPTKLKETKAIYDEFLKFRHLLTEELVRHEKLADGVYRTSYSNGEFTVVNYNDSIYDKDGIRVAAKGWKLFPVKGRKQKSAKLPNLRRWRAPAEVAKEHVRGLIILEAEGFADYGDWRIDTQFVHKMGSAYLLAVGVGKPIGAASTKVEIPRAGKWTVWARCNDWMPSHSPGRFTVSVDGKEGKVLGACGRKGWAWERSGVVELPAGKVDVKLVDKTGSYARCDAVILAEDASYVPPDGDDAVEAERRRLKGLKADIADGGEYDVVVVGAGTTGMGACIAAARNGAKTALIQDRPVLGGNASHELGVAIHGAAHCHPNSRETGLIEEARLIRSRMCKDGANISISAAYDEQVQGEKRLKTFLNNRVVKVEKGAGGIITAVVARNTLTGEWTRYRGKMFIDTTGDGWIGYYAGVPYRYGREGQSEFGEMEAPDKPDNTTMSGVVISDGVWCFGFKDTGKPVAFETPEWAKSALPDGWSRKFPARLRERGGFGPSWKVEHPGTVNDFTDPEFARDELVRLSFAYFGWGKNEWEHRNLLKNHELTYVPFIDARRETLRLVGDYILTGNDQKSAKVFPDRISYGGWSMDTHDPLGFANPHGDGYWKHHPQLPIYTIPYRILYNPDFGNLFFAGRCSSVSHMALGSVRLESTLAALGQVCGTAAALCVRYGDTPKSFGEKRMKMLQQRLLKDDLYIPGIVNEDPRDLARLAKVTASSSQDRIYFRETPSLNWSIPKFKVAYSNKKDPSRPGWRYSEGASPSDVIDGTARIFENEAHAWVSDAKQQLPQSIMLEWEKPVDAFHVQVTFNSDLMPARTAAMPSQLVKSYVVEVRSGGSWTQVAAETENWRRMARHWFEKRKIDAVRITCFETWGDPSAQIFEIRVY